jgi:hypothetical protein
VNDVPDHGRFDDGLHWADLLANGSDEDGSGAFAALLRIEVRVLLIREKRGGIGDGFGRDVRVEVVRDDEWCSRRPFGCERGETTSLSACGMCSATMAP